MLGHHLFMCNRSQYESNMRKFCTKTCINHNKISGHTNEKLFVQIDDYFPAQLQYRIIVPKNVNPFAHTNITP